MSKKEGVLSGKKGWTVAGIAGIIVLIIIFL